jgi:aminopeptidase N
LPLDLLKFNIDSIIGFGSQLSYSYDSLYLAIQLPNTMNIGDTGSVRIYYHGRPTPDPSWGGFKFDGTYAYNLGIGLNSNPVNMGRSWFPCFDNFVERATMGINIESKLPKRGYAIGTFLGETVVTGDTILRSYRMDQPVTTYITHMAVSEYTQVDYIHNAMNGPLPFQLVARAVDTLAMRNTFAGLGDAVDALESWWGPYWWERVGYIITPQGAMEHPTSIAYPRSVGLSGNSVGHQDLMSHELGHCWWGDVVTLVGPQEMWIKEGNAEYSGHLFAEYLYGRENFINKVKLNHKEVLISAHFDDGTYQALSGMPFEYTYGTHTYYKGAAMLHNMRTYLGDSLFRVGQQAVLNANAYSAIDAAQYRDGLTAATGKDMSDFFDAWIFSPGYAAYELNDISYVNQGSTYRTSFEVEQKLRGATVYHRNAPLEIRFYDADGASFDVSVIVSGQYDTASVDLPFIPSAWTVNPQNSLNLAQMHYSFKTAAALSSYQVPFVDVLLNFSTPADTLAFRIDHYYTAPDAIQNNPSNARISNSHYWKIDGNFEEILGIARFEYNAYTLPQLDADLVSQTEDSLILVYRPSSYHDWREFPYYTRINLFNSTDGNGFIRADRILPGEYAFANGSLPDFVAADKESPVQIRHLNLFPNPAVDYFTIEGNFGAQLVELKVEIFDLSGKLLQNDKVFVENDFSSNIPVNMLPQGVYILKISDEKGMLLDSQTIGIVRK